MLPPLTVAGAAAALAAVSLLAGDTGVLRVITVATALTACGGAALARSWDRSAGRTVAELTAARVRDEWRTDERIAELEMDLEESREIRGRLEKKLRGKRAELARLRTEHADLLRRYATAESERARVLESRRLLELEAAPRPLAIGASSAIGPAAFLKAEQALRDLSRNAARQQAQRTVEEARRRDAATPEEEPQGRHAAEIEGGDHTRTAPSGLPVREHRLVPAVAAAVLPYARPHRTSGPGQGAGHRAIGGFDFFGTQNPDKPEPAADPAGPDRAPELPSAAADDLADVVGDEAYAEHEQAEASAESGQDAAPEVIDLTAHDETEQLDMSELRAQA
jgi:hypothetical protein